MTYPNTQLFINGQWCDAAAGESLAVFNPATGKEIGRVAHARIPDLDRALHAAQKGFETWRSMLPIERNKIMRKAAALMRERAADIAAVMTQEQGKPLAEAKVEAMAAADITGDGLPEVYVTNYRTTTYRDGFDGAKPSLRVVDGKPVAVPSSRFGATRVRGGGVMVNERGEVDVLYRNKGGGVFGPISWTAGAFLDARGQALTEAPHDWGLSVAFRDLDGDLQPEIYVCNDFLVSRDAFWRNTGSKGFQAVMPEAIRQISMSSMGVDFADINRDGIDDFVVVDMLSADPAARQRQ